MRVEAKINSQLMKCKKGSGAAALKKKQDQEKKEADAKAKASKDGQFYLFICFHCLKKTIFFIYNFFYFFQTQ